MGKIFDPVLFCILLECYKAALLFVEICSSFGDKRSSEHTAANNAYLQCWNILADKVSEKSKNIITYENSCIDFCLTVHVLR